MLNSLKAWVGEVTTGHGVMVLAGTLLSILSGQITWALAAPLLAAGVVGLIWPEKAASQAARQAGTAGMNGPGTAFDHTAFNHTAFNNKAATPAAPSARD